MLIAYMWQNIIPYTIPESWKSQLFGHIEALLRMMLR